MTAQTKTCPRCGDEYPADLPRRFWIGPETCDPCQDQALENYGNYMRRRIEHMRRQRELETSDHARATDPDPDLRNIL